MDNLILIIHDFFVPTRVIWPEWYEGFLIKQLMVKVVGHNPLIPTITSPNGGWTKGSLADSIIRLVLIVKFWQIYRAYAKVIRDWYINQKYSRC